MRGLACGLLALVVATAGLAADHDTLPPTHSRPLPPLAPAETATESAVSLDSPSPFLDRPEAAVVRHRDTFPSGRDKVAVDVFRPGADGQYPVVLLFHGAHPRKTEKHYLRMAEDLAANGYLSLYVRYYERGRKGRGSRSQWSQTVHDAVTYATSLTCADPERVGVVGYSLGAFLTLGRAPADERIRALVAYYGGISRNEPAEIARTMPPTLLLHGTADRIVPVRRSLEAFASIRDLGRTADLVVYPGVRHGFCLNGRGGPDGSAARDAWSRTLAFLHLHLARPDPPGTLLSSVSGSEPPLCTMAGTAFPPFLSNPPGYLAPMGLGTIPGGALINPSAEQVQKILAASRPRPRARRPGAHRPSTAATPASSAVSRHK